MDRALPTQKHVETMAEVVGIEASPMAPQMFGNAGREHMEKYGQSVEQNYLQIFWLCGLLMVLECSVFSTFLIHIIFDQDNNHTCR